MNKLCRVVVSGCIMISLGVMLAEANPPTTRPSSSFVPPVFDAPANRVGGAARGSRADPELLVSLLAPSSSVGLTAKSQPTLYWYLTKPTDRPIEITLTPRGDGGKDVGADPILDVTIPKTETGGLQAFSLAKPPAGQQPVSLQPGVQYDWVVEIVVHDRSGSDNPNATTRLERIPASDAVSKAESSSPQDQYEVYRQAGLWYDLLDNLNQMIAADKNNADLRQTRRELLKDQSLVEDENGKITEAAK